MAQWVIFNDDDGNEKAMVCFYNDNDRQADLMHRKSIDRQVRKWQETNSGNPPKFYSKIKIKEFTNRNLNFSNI